MTEYDRGAYTPHADAPLAFDPRSPRERRPVPMTLVASGAILAVLCGAVVMAYRHHGGVGGEPRTVGAPVGAVKTVAAPDATPKDPAATLDVYAPQNVTATPAFAPAPEEPAPRPASRVQVQPTPEPAVRIETPPPPATSTTRSAPIAAQASAPATAPATAVVRGAADADTRTITPPVAAAPVAPHATRMAAAKPAAVAARPKPAHSAAMTVAAARETDATIDAALARSAHPTAAAAKAPAAYAPAAHVLAAAAAKPASRPVAAVKPAATSGASGKVVVQIGAYNSTAIADAQFAAAKAAVGGGHGKAVSAVTVGGKTLYRTAFTGFADKAAARAFCSKLTAAGHACIVKG